MKLVTMALVCLLLATVWLQDVDSMSMHVSASRCCFSFVAKKIPWNKIQCYRNTSSNCSYKATIFKLKGRRESCVLTEDTWVQAYLKKMKPCLPK
ncbi:C-C motif chemokine 1 [Castor canadensis]|uniref:C-C motif chemokine 1 n=2 Tax=Castor canadensis TaxID=51338 RepID=A0A8B7TTD9_CASCN|nr:C-C motif chemokine 1 [Castor canadensis]